MQKSKYGTAFMVLFFNALFCHAQFYKKKAVFASAISASAYATPKSPFVDTTGHYGYNQYAVSAVIPLGGNFVLKERDSRPKLTQFFFTPAVSIGTPSISFLSKKRTLVNVGLGVSGLHYYGKNNTLLGGAYSFIGEDSETISNPDIRYAGFLVWNHHIPDLDFSYKFGFVYAYLLGTGIPLPVVGFTANLTESSRLNFVFPITLSYSYIHNKKNQYRLFLSPTGTFNNISNSAGDIGFNNGQLDVVQMRRTQMRLGFDARIKLSDHFLLKAETGIVGGRHLAFSYFASTSNTTLYETQIEPAMYVSVGLSWKIFKKNKKVTAGDAPILEDLSYENLNMEKGEKASPEFIDFTAIDIDQLDINDLDIGDISLDDIDLEDIDLENFDIEDLNIKDIDLDDVPIEDLE